MNNIAKLAAAALVVLSAAACGDNLEGPDATDPADPADPSDPANPDPTDPNDPIAKYPASCMDVGNGAPVADGEYTLYAGGDEHKAYTALCKDNNEFLKLVHVESWENVSELQGLISGNLTSLETHYTALRIDPETLMVDVADRTFATSSAPLAINGVQFDSMVAGSAMACDVNAIATSNLDLRGTPFKITSSFDVQTPVANLAGAQIMFDDQTVDLWAAQSDCAWVSPAGGPADPRNANAPAFVMQLAYAN